MKNIWIIIKKELYRIMKEPRLWLALILPGILIYALYSIMGNAMQNTTGVDDSQRYKIAFVGAPAAFTDIVNDDEIYKINLAEDAELSGKTVDELAEMLDKEELHAYVVFEGDFATKLEAREKPGVTVYYDSGEMLSATAQEKLTAALGKYLSDEQDRALGGTGASQLFEQRLENTVDVNKALGGVFAMLVPLLMLSFLFSGCISVAPEAIAGEKERGTIATLLVTPTKRSHIAIGKIVALSILSLLSALSSFIGLMLSMPALMGVDSLGSLYGAGEYALIFLVLIATVLVIIGVMSVISAIAKNVKEATMLIMPFMVLSMVVGIMPMVTQGATASLPLYFIPLYNTAQSLVSILSFEMNVAGLVVTILMNLVVMAACVVGLAKIFNSERIMFSK